MRYAAIRGAEVRIRTFSMAAERHCQATPHSFCVAEVWSRAQSDGSSVISSPVFPTQGPNTLPPA
jgi:hypothetical protein